MLKINGFYHFHHIVGQTVGVLSNTEGNLYNLHYEEMLKY